MQDEDENGRWGEGMMEEEEKRRRKERLDGGGGCGMGGDGFGLVWVALGGTWVTWVGERKKVGAQPKVDAQGWREPEGGRQRAKDAGECCSAVLRSVGAANTGADWYTAHWNGVLKPRERARQSTALCSRKEKRGKAAAPGFGPGRRVAWPVETRSERRMGVEAGGSAVFATSD